MSSKLSSIQKDLDGFSKNRASIEYFQKLKDKAQMAQRSVSFFNFSSILSLKNKIIKKSNTWALAFLF